jgi:hypothetical protein
MVKIFRRREYGSIDKLISAIDCWVHINKEYCDTNDFLVILQKIQEKPKYNSWNDLG